MTATATGIYALIVGVLTLAGYAFLAPRLTDWSGHGISMFPNAAVCAAGSGLAILLLVIANDSRFWRIVLRSTASFVGVIGGLTLVEHLARVGLGIDRLLFQPSWGQRAAAAPMRMGPPASTSYLIIGAALLLATYGPPARRIAGALAIVIVAIASLSLVGYWFGADLLFGVARFTGIAFQTSTVLAAIGIGLIASLPDQGLAAMLRRDDPGGVIVRRLLLPVVVMPVVLGWLRGIGQQAGYFDTAFGTALLALSVIAMLFALLWWTAEGVSRQTQLAQVERERAERALKEADRRKDEFLATLSHELRNVLAPVAVGAQLLRDAGDHPDLVEEAATVIQRQVPVLTRIVDDLLDVSRIAAGKLDLRYESVDLATVLRSAIEIAKPAIFEMRHELVLTLPAETAAVQADPVRLAQVFANLLNNAAKYTPPGGSIHVTEVLEAGDVAVFIRDTGFGIAPDLLPNIFDMFMQVAPGHARSRGGMGIGLTLVKRLVELHGGSVTASSEGLGRGSEFVVRLRPVTATESPAPLSARSE
ncbi:MAG TPA: HAMP domain-containing sensor histidine kinase [Thermoanaerobaculia bacterium]|nr:HAMP domain-containing sensor histidine kinase [Thermoanaerobaculia bacterium]